MPTTLAFIRQRLATLRAAVDELADLAAEVEQTEVTGASLLPPEMQAQEGKGRRHGKASSFGWGFSALPASRVPAKINY